MGCANSRSEDLTKRSLLESDNFMTSLQDVPGYFSKTIHTSDFLEPRIPAEQREKPEMSYTGPPSHLRNSVDFHPYWHLVQEDFLPREGVPSGLLPRTETAQELRDIEVREAITELREQVKQKICVSLNQQEGALPERDEDENENHIEILDASDGSSVGDSGRNSGISVDHIDIALSGEDEVDFPFAESVDPTPRNLVQINEEDLDGGDEESAIYKSSLGEGGEGSLNGAEQETLDFLDSIINESMLWDEETGEETVKDRVEMEQKEMIVERTEDIQEEEEEVINMTETEESTDVKDQIDEAREETVIDTPVYKLRHKSNDDWNWSLTRPKHKDQQMKDYEKPVPGINLGIVNMSDFPKDNNHLNRSQQLFMQKVYLPEQNSNGVLTNGNGPSRSSRTLPPAVAPKPQTKPQRHSWVDVSVNEDGGIVADDPPSDDSGIKEDTLNRSSTGGIMDIIKTFNQGEDSSSPSLAPPIQQKKVKKPKVPPPKKPKPKTKLPNARNSYPNAEILKQSSYKRHMSDDASSEDSGFPSLKRDANMYGQAPTSVSEVSVK